MSHPTGDISHSHTYCTGVTLPVPRLGLTTESTHINTVQRKNFFSQSRVAPLVTYPLRVGPVHTRPTTILVYPMKVALLTTTSTHNSLCLSTLLPEARPTGTITTIPSTLQPPALEDLGKEGIMQPSNQLKGRIVTALPQPTQLTWLTRGRSWSNSSGAVRGRTLSGAINRPNHESSDCLLHHFLYTGDHLQGRSRRSSVGGGALIGLIHSYS